MSFITKNVSNLIDEKHFTKQVNRPFLKLPSKRKYINPQYLAAIIRINGPEEYLEVVNTVMNLYDTKQITKGEAQARLWSFARECQSRQKF